MTETAVILGLTRETMRQWLKNGKLNGQRMGNMVLITEEEVNRLKGSH